MSPHISRRHALAAAATGATGLALTSVEAIAQPVFGGYGQGIDVRIATFNTSLSRPVAGQLVRALRTRTDAQARAIARIIQINNPDILLINEIDLDEDGAAVDLLRRNYLEVSQTGTTSVHYPYAFTAPVNTGEPTGLDLDGDGSTTGPGDAFGYGAFPGQYGMAILSRFPIRTADVRTFQKLLWKDMPSNLLPESYYPAAAREILRLSSKSHWDVPVTVGGTQLHLLAAHPTPPVFDGGERRNARRNHDEIRLWADYLTGGSRAAWITDDAGRSGGLAAGASAVVLGDLNADPSDGESWDGSAQQLLSHARLRDSRPQSDGALAAATTEQGHEAQRTARFDPAPQGPGDLRVDYVLPTSDLTVVGSGVFWPADGQSGADLVTASDHRLVRLDLRLDA